MKLYGKDKPVGILEGFFISGRVPHGIIFTGEKGAGKTALAAYAAKLMLCGKGGKTPCGACKPCIKAENKNHPDIFYVKELAEKGKYNVSFLREIIKESVRRPNDGDLKVYIFSDCDDMPPACQNTLLKFIEEPPPFNRFIFTASSVGKVLETVISRLTKIEVGLPAEDECASILTDAGAAEDEAYDIVQKIGLNPGKALEFLNNKKTDVKNDAESVFRIARRITDGLFRSNEYEVSSAFTFIRDRDMLLRVLELLLGVFRDAVMNKCKSKDLSGFYTEGAADIAKKYGLNELMRAQKLVISYIGRLEQNPSLTLVCAAYAGRIYSALTEL